MPPPRPARAARARDRGCDRRPRPWSAAAGARRCRRAPAGPRGWCRCRSRSPASLTSLATMRSQPFCASFSAAWRSTSSVSAAKPTTTGARPLSSARMSGFRVSASAGASPSASFFSFCGASSARPIVGHRRRHHHHRRAVDAGQHRLAHLRAPSRTSTRVTPGRRRQRRRPGHQRDLGAAPRRARRDGEAHLARRAVAEEAHRIDRLVGRPGRHQHAPSRPNPAGRAARRTRAAMSAASIMRPSPIQPQASSPASGPTVCAPRSTSVRRLACVAGWRHMFTFIAGASEQRRAAGQRHRRQTDRWPAPAPAARSRPPSPAR